MHSPDWCLMLTVMAGDLGRDAYWVAHKARLAGCYGRQPEHFTKAHQLTNLCQRRLL